LKLRLQPDEDTLAQLPSLDEELLLRAEAARKTGDLNRSEALLCSMENRDAPGWAVAMGEVCFARQEYAAAAKWYMDAEEIFPEQTLPRLEQCFEALEDYKLAYHYACKQRDKER
jgi:tetratricopeptide (TPR) repeat protein